jgi:hypothetical protein
MGSSLLNSELHQVFILLFTKSMVVRKGSYVFWDINCRSYEEMEGVLKVYVYEEGDRSPIVS